MTSKYTRRLPEGVLAGESVPPENDRDELNVGLVEELARELGERPGYRRHSFDKRREIARRKLK